MNGSNKSDRGRETIESEDIPQRLADDQFYRSLASSHRRRLLCYLLEENESTVDELATVLCGWEASASKTFRQPGDRNKLFVKLHHSHLPRLSNAGLIEYDPLDGSVRLERLHPEVRNIIHRSIMVESVDV